MILNRLHSSIFYCLMLHVMHIYEYILFIKWLLGCAASASHPLLWSHFCEFLGGKCKSRLNKWARATGQTFYREIDMSQKWHNIIFFFSLLKILSCSSSVNLQVYKASHCTVERHGDGSNMGSKWWRFHDLEPSTGHQPNFKIKHEKNTFRIQKPKNDDDPGYHLNKWCM